MKKKDQKEYSAGIALIVAGAIGVTTSIRALRRESKKREQIRIERDAQLQAIAIARALVLDRLHAGQYSSVGEAMDDFSFEVMVARYDD